MIINTVYSNNPISFITTVTGFNSYDVNIIEPEVVSDDIEIIMSFDEEASEENG